MEEGQRRSRQGPLQFPGSRGNTTKDWHPRTQLLVLSRSQLLVARDHRRTKEASNTIKVKITRGLLRKGHQVLFMSRNYTGGARSQTKSSGALWDCRRILESYNILEAEHIRTVVVKNQHLKRINAYKIELHWGISEAVYTREPLKRGYKVVPMSKGDTGEAMLQGREALLMSKGDTVKTELQGRTVHFMSQGNTGEVEPRGRKDQGGHGAKLCQCYPVGGFHSCRGQPRACPRDS